MKAIQKPITGKRETEAIPHSVDKDIYEALQLFYKAFNSRDLELMERSWSQSDEIAMDNPLGGIKRGWQEIRSVYQRIFSGDAAVYVKFYDYTILEFEGGFCVIGRERGHLKRADRHLDLAIRTSRVYRRINGDYRQVHHHGSIEDPKLLAQYQDLVK